MKASIKLSHLFSSLFFIFLGLVSPLISSAQTGSAHEYAQLTRERVSEALAEKGGKEEMILAEGSLMGLGWFVLYGNDKASADIAYKMGEVVTDVYNGTDKMDVIYMKHTSMGYGEMLNLNRFDKNRPICPSSEYESLALQRIKAAFADGAGYEEFTLAEGSLVALGWLTAYGWDDASSALGNQLMNKAFALWPNSDEIYALQSSASYSEIINLGRFKLDKKEGRFTSNMNGTVSDAKTGLIWLRSPIQIAPMTWEAATDFVKTIKDGLPINQIVINDGSKAGDWRMPTNEEWQTFLANIEESNATEDTFVVNDEIRYWSSTPPANDFGAYHISLLGDGKADFDGREKAYAVWPVRVIK